MAYTRSTTASRRAEKKEPKYVYKTVYNVKGTGKKAKLVGVPYKKEDLQ